MMNTRTQANGSLAMTKQATPKARRFFQDNDVTVWETDDGVFAYQLDGGELRECLTLSELCEDFEALADAFTDDEPEEETGWRTVYGREVYVEDGKVIRGVKRDGMDATTVYPYRSEKRGGWINCDGLTLSAFRAGVKRGTIDLF